MLLWFRVLFFCFRMHKRLAKDDVFVYNISITEKNDPMIREQYR